MVVTLILILLIVVFMAFFIGLNLKNFCTFWFFKTFTDLPVSVLALIAFGAGIIFALLFIFVAKMKAPPSDAEERAVRKLQKEAKKAEKQAKKVKDNEPKAEK
ncbi:MAG: lipopolysaccharide assembly protein LapA domain-containing protein [Treponema sp.]|nr:lipopolysaccharide assembly protein LapA domain-containing protein [Treponema sp.]